MEKKLHNMLPVIVKVFFICGTDRVISVVHFCTYFTAPTFLKYSFCTLHMLNE